MAVRLNERFAVQLRQGDLFLQQKLRQRLHRLRQAHRGFISWEKIRQLVAKYRDAARLESDDGDAFLELRPQCIHRLAQKILSHAQKTPIVERSSAAEALAR